MAIRLMFVMLALAFALSAHAETVTGEARSQAELDRAMKDFKFQVVNTAVRGNEYTYGAVAYCVPSHNRAVIKYAFTHGEPNAERAEKKALFALDSVLGGKCFASPKITIIRSDQL